MPLHTELDEVQKTQFFGMIQESLSVRTHFEFMLWSQGNVQAFLPHDIMIAAWGDFSLGLISFDVVSPLPGMRTQQVQHARLVPLLKRLFNYWHEQGDAPLSMRMQHGLFSENQFGFDQLGEDFARMKSGMIHGIKDSRGRHDCLYILLNASDDLSQASRTMLETLLPYVDCTLRQIEPIAVEPPKPVTTSIDEGFGTLSIREHEIMDWVKQGKTNYEIGMILDISAFTVKNHLQRIFKKLDVLNRAQAVAKLSMMPEPNESV
ncbi:MAG TPA: XrtB/PEP-CTERM-associated transcriptional regulator EpsA [Methylophilaceae bacterium]|nr:XrtB/PEP-CTERM-associated transcriptional regulator EpsA [Methylophilaceae bacterium]